MAKLVYQSTGLKVNVADEQVEQMKKLGFVEETPKAQTTQASTKKKATAKKKG
jgi:hypothetical protein